MCREADEKSGCTGGSVWLVADEEAMLGKDEISISFSRQRIGGRGRR